MVLEGLKEDNSEVFRWYLGVLEEVIVNGGGDKVMKNVILKLIGKPTENLDRNTDMLETILKICEQVCKTINNARTFEIPLMLSEVINEMRTKTHPETFSKILSTI